MNTKFTIPKLVKYDDNSKPWYVYFRYEKKLFRYKFSLNYIKDLSEREHEFREACKILLNKLRSGWNPNVKDYEQEFSSLTFKEALIFALDKKKPNVSTKTYKGYTTTMNFVVQSAELLGFENTKIVDIRRVHIKLVLEKLITLRSWSNKAYNKNLNYLKAILSELVQWDVIENNPAFKIASLPEEESFANVPASLTDMQRIKTTLETDHISFYVFVISIFHMGVRPEELLRITLGMIDLKNSQIVLESGITKTRKQRIVPINKYLHEFYSALKFESLPKDYYLFGSFKTPGIGNRGKNQFLQDFIPGPTRVSRDTATRRWETIVKTGLKIKMNLYAMKHFGADQKILAGISLDTLRELYGHTSTLMTEKYAKKVKEVYRRQIMDQSPDF